MDSHLQEFGRFLGFAAGSGCSVSRDVGDRPSHAEQWTTPHTLHVVSNAIVTHHP